MTPDQLTAEFEEIAKALTPIEKALYLADMLRAVYKAPYVIDAQRDGGFTIKLDWRGASTPYSLPDTPSV